MSIYLFTITYYDYILIVHVYSIDEVRAKQSIIDIHGCEDWQVDFAYEDDTHLPMNWNKDLGINLNY